MAAGQSPLNTSWLSFTEITWKTIVHWFSAITVFGMLSKAVRWWNELVRHLKSHIWGEGVTHTDTSTPPDPHTSASTYLHLCRQVNCSQARVSVSQRGSNKKPQSVFLWRGHKQIWGQLRAFSLYAVVNKGNTFNNHPHWQAICRPCCPDPARPPGQRRRTGSDIM